MLAVDWYALTWLGMANALREPRYIRAVLRTIGPVLVLPWAVCFLFLFCTRPNNETAHGFFLLWFVGSAVFDMALGGWAKSALLSQFRRWAANDFSARRPVPQSTLLQGKPMLRRF